MASITSLSDELSLRRCLHTVRDMLIDRGFDVSEVGLTERVEAMSSSSSDSTEEAAYHVSPFHWTEEMHATLAEHLLQQSTMPIFVPHRSPGVPTVAVMVVWKPLVGHHDLFKSIQHVLEQVTELTTSLTSESTVVTWPPSHIILLTSTPLRTTDWKHLMPFQKKVRIEAFHQGETEFNRTRHEYVPEHKLLSNEDAVAILRALNTSGQQCPRIQTSDIICRYYGGRVGDVFQIRRVDLSTGDIELTFRIVTSA